MSFNCGQSFDGFTHFSVAEECDFHLLSKKLEMRSWKWKYVSGIKYQVLISSLILESSLKKVPRSESGFLYELIKLIFKKRSHYMLRLYFGKYLHKLKSCYLIRFAELRFLLLDTEKLNKLSCLHFLFLTFKCRSGLQTEELEHHSVLIDIGIWCSEQFFTGKDRTCTCKETESLFSD